MACSESASARLGVSSAVRCCTRSPDSISARQCYILLREIRDFRATGCTGAHYAATGNRYRTTKEVSVLSVDRNVKQAVGRCQHEQLALPVSALRSSGPRGGRQAVLPQGHCGTVRSLVATAPRAMIGFSIRQKHYSTRCTSQVIWPTRTSLSDPTKSCGAIVEKDASNGTSGNMWTLRKFFILGRA